MVLCRQLDPVFASGLGVLALGASSTVPTDGQAVSTAVEVPWAPTEDALSAWWAAVDEGFFKTYGLESLAGRVFSDAFPADRIENLPDDMDGFEAQVLINKSALAFLGLPSAIEDELRDHLARKDLDGLA